MRLLQVVAAVDVPLGARQAVARVLAGEADRAVLPARDALVLAADGGALADGHRTVLGRGGGRGGAGDEEPEGRRRPGERAASVHGGRIVRPVEVLERPQSTAVRQGGSVARQGA